MLGALNTSAILAAAGPLTLLYRGSLSSCNYACSYCPFAKRKESRSLLKRDAQELARFIAWCGQQNRPLRVFFTPWGEALVRKHYRQAILQLAAMPHIQQVAVQTNLSVPLSWLQDAPGLQKIALWCTYHPDQTTQARFLQRCQRLTAISVRYSVGVVALRVHLPAIRAMRKALPQHIYLWLNAFDRRGPGYYSAEELAELDALDPWFIYNRKPVPSRGKPCSTGQDVLSVDGNGTLTRCHFVEEILGNLYQTPLENILQERLCPRSKCDCFIGYVHRPDLPLQQAFGYGRLARIV